MQEVFESGDDSICDRRLLGSGGNNDTKRAVYEGMFTNWDNRAVR